MIRKNIHIVLDLMQSVNSVIGQCNSMGFSTQFNSLIYGKLKELDKEQKNSLLKYVIIVNKEIHKFWASMTYKVQF